MATAQRRMSPRGIALIEALVALAVMAFGLLSVAGLQVVLRQNADNAKQRSEAVRLAQEAIETWRSYSTLVGPVGTVAYNNLVTPPGPTDIDGSNTTFTLTRSVVDSPIPAYKTLTVDVDWVDRVGAPQNVRLSTAVLGVDPALAATVSIPSNGLPTARPRGRAAGIPLDAVTLSPTKTGFRPPQDTTGPAEVWIFDNVTGVITICTTTATTTSALSLANNISGCTTGRAQLLSGYVNFALPTVAGLPRPPTAADAEYPTSAALPIQVQVLRTLPSTLTVSCFTEQLTLYVQYYCAVPVSALLADVPEWSGRSITVGMSALTDDTAVVGADRLRPCRYTRYRDDRTVASETITNEEHPLDYHAVRGPLMNQNFLVIRAGNGFDAYDCPADNTSTPVDSTTWRHPLS